MPKSRSFDHAGARVTNTFVGFKSRWMMEVAMSVGNRPIPHLGNSRTRANRPTKPSIHSSDRFASPSTYSRTRYCRPVFGGPGIDEAAADMGMDGGAPRSRPLMMKARSASFGCIRRSQPKT